MNKYIILAAVALVLSCGCQVSAKEKKTSGSVSGISLLVKEYSANPDFEVLNIGGLGMSIVKGIMRKNLGEEDMDVFDTVRGLRRVVIASYDDCDETTKSEFTSRLSKLLDRDYLLLEAKDSGEKVEIYGFPSEDGSVITDLVINSPGALICLRGTVNVDAVGKMIESRGK